MSNIYFFLIVLAWLSSCGIDSVTKGTTFDAIYNKSLFNSKWKKQNISPEEWYYRRTVINAPANAVAFSNADGHFLHPDLIRWEISKDFLFGWKANAEVIGAENEQDPNLRKNYRGAPLLAFRIVEHLDNDRASSKNWSQREFIKIDWSRNFIDQGKRQDIKTNLSLADTSAYLADTNFFGNPLRARVGNDFIDITTRHPMYASRHEKSSHGFSFAKESAALITDIRHSFIRKKESDYLPLAFPDKVMALNEISELASVAINKRFGFFRTGFDGQELYDSKRGSVKESKLLNATLFNIWQNNTDAKKNPLPLRERIPRRIFYYTNIFHPDELFSASEKAVKAWDDALRTMVFYAQKGKYKSVDDIAPILVLQKNSCSIQNLEKWFQGLDSSSRAELEEQAHTSLEAVKTELEKAHGYENYRERFQTELRAKAHLEQLCSALEYFSENSEQPFFYQRPGDLRFNLINVITDNSAVSWGAYAPLFADPLSGEIVSATANINLKYIDQFAYKFAARSTETKERMHYRQVLPQDNAVRNFRHRVFSVEKAQTKSSLSMQARDLNLDRFEAKLLGHIEKKVRPELFDRSKNLVARNFDQGFLSLKSTGKTAFLDPIEYIENLALGSSKKYAHLEKEESFLAIREEVFQALVLHSLGHNLGLKHNREASSDPINFDPLFWQIEKLPKDSQEALPIAKDDIRAQLQKCQSTSTTTITTQDCLSSLIPMSSSIMSYPAAGARVNNNLGLYDKAAIKFAYGNLVEVFPERNLGLDIEKEDPKQWLRFNDYREIPKILLKNYEAIHQRKHQSFTWNSTLALKSFPKNAVPYAYCDEASAALEPRCTAFNSGPDLRAHALLLEENFWNSSPKDLFDEHRSLRESTSALLKELQILDHFTHTLHWYYYFVRNEPKFRGSYAEKDYLSALAIGINLFSQIIGSPQAGAHLSQPHWLLNSNDTSLSRLGATTTLIPFSELKECEAMALSRKKNGVLEGRGNYKFIEIPFGMGRALHPINVHGLEQDFIIDAGSALLKKYALYSLAAPMMPDRISSLERRDITALSWHDLFPEAVEKIYHAVITEERDTLGPELNNNEIKPRLILNENDFTLHQSVAEANIASAFDDDLSIFALMSAFSFFSTKFTDNFQRSLHISSTVDDTDVISDASHTFSYTHLSGYRYSAADFRDVFSVGSSLLKKAQQQKAYYLKLSACVSDENLRISDPLCHCVKTSIFTDGKEQCCDEDNAACSQATLEPVGSEMCSLTELLERQQSALDTLNYLIGFIHKLRELSKNSPLHS